MLRREQVFLRDSGRQGRGWSRQGPLSGKDIREGLVTRVFSVDFGLHVSKMELCRTVGLHPRESLEGAGVMR